MKKRFFCATILCMVWFSAYCRGSERRGRISGFVTTVFDQAHPAVGADVTFTGTAGHAVTAKANARGRYEISLPEGEYWITASTADSLLCESERPYFRLAPGAAIHFNFRMMCWSGDRITVQGQNSVQVPKPIAPDYWCTDRTRTAGNGFDIYDEDWLALGRDPKEYVVLIHGACHREGNAVFYERPYITGMLARRPQVPKYLSAEICFGTRTVRGDSVQFDLVKNVITVTGNVSIEDAAGKTEHTSACVKLDLNKKREFRIVPCYATRAR